MKIALLRPAWLTRTDDGMLLRHPQNVRPNRVVGVQFLCPVCFASNGLKVVGTRNFLCYGDKAHTWLHGSSFDCLSLRWGLLRGRIITRDCDHGFRVVDGRALVSGPDESSRQPNGF